MQTATAAGDGIDRAIELPVSLLCAHGSRYHPTLRRSGVRDDEATLSAFPSTRSVLLTLPKRRLLDLGRDLGIVLLDAATRDGQVDALLAGGARELEGLVRALGRDELKAACRAHGIDDSGRARSELQGRLLAAYKPGATKPPSKPLRTERDLYAPIDGDIVVVRHRQYFVEGVIRPDAADEATRVKLVCLDDDAQGRHLEVLWELELGARVIEPEARGLGDIAKLDDPRRFAAYLHALKWSSVTATDAKLFQAPFRAGIKLLAHQLTPLKKALELPRANLFIADDVGLGKTIEAGLVLQELLLRQRVERALIVCPAAVVLQWQSEMEKRFGLRFEVYSRAFVARRRQERGFAVNPWTTHTRFIISYQTLRRPEYRDPLLAVLGQRAPRSLLILDEAHNAAPASATKYAVDSRTTHVIRDLAPCFENRLFLSATPHNGHSNSFSALLELLDPQRFTRGVAVANPKQLEPVMVRRLKSDLRALGEPFPERKVVQIDLRHEGDTWFERTIVGDTTSAPVALAKGEPAELRLSEMLAEYTALRAPRTGARNNPQRLVFVNLQKRLLSSIEAFHRTLRAHAIRFEEEKEDSAPEPSDLDTDTYGVDDEEVERAADAEMDATSRLLGSAEGRARELLDAMLALSAKHCVLPDAKIYALLAWMRKHQCAGVRLDHRGKLSAADRAWSDQRLLIFTEYGDTKRYLQQILASALSDTDNAEARVRTFHGGMSDDQREEVQRAFNSPPDAEALRILVATDAAREGVNLQGHCADLIHFDVPWNPARMEQRNGRIDRTLQDSPEVRCMYFFYPQRPEDQVLRTVVIKVDTIQRELGSLGAVVLDRFAEILDAGIDERTESKLTESEQVGLFRETTKRELEATRETKRVAEEVDAARKILSASQKIMDFESALLRDAIDVGCELAGCARLFPRKPLEHEKHLATFELPTMPESWQDTIDTLRPPRHRDEDFYEWRKRPPLPVVFDAPARMNSALAQLHLAHPFVKRVLSRFLAQGYSAHDLSRVSVIPNPKDAVARVIAFGRLSLFGHGATRLHDQLVSVAAQWLESKTLGHLRPFAEEADRKALGYLEQLLTQAVDVAPVPPLVSERLRASAPSDFATLWKAIEDEADAVEHEARRKLKTRADVESAALRQILEAQRTAIENTLHGPVQLGLEFGERERSQLAQDRKHMAMRLTAIEKEIATEPEVIGKTYEVALRRLEPVGLVYLWPTTR
jgi:superfamily II DNA or RNA helicase